MNRTKLTIGLLQMLVLLSAPLVLQAADTLVIPEKVVFGKSVYIRDNVKDECKLEEKMASFIRANAGPYSNVVHEKPKGGDYHVLSVEIIDVQGAGGGAWSGTKSITIQGKLTDAKGQQLGTFTARRFSGGGAFGGFKGTCSIMGRCTKALGQDVGLFLRNPTANARLGDH